MMWIVPLYRKTALMWAEERGHAECVKVLKTCTPSRNTGKRRIELIVGQVQSGALASG
jgi:hypothetical protein